MDPKIYGFNLKYFILRKKRNFYLYNVQVLIRWNTKEKLYTYIFYSNASLQPSSLIHFFDAVNPNPAIKATTVNPCAAILVLIMYCDIRLSPRRKQYKP